MSAQHTKTPLDRIEIVIDTREQTPWHFDEAFADVTTGTLRIGDYALRGDLNFAVERKSLDDFLGTISSGWDRFRRELERARAAGFTLPIVIEGRLEDCFYSIDERGTPCPPQHDHPNVFPAFVLKRIGELTHMGASVFFAENAHYAMAVAYSMLNERHALKFKQDLKDKICHKKP